MPRKVEAARLSRSHFSILKVIVACSVFGAMMACSAPGLAQSTETPKDLSQRSQTGSHSSIEQRGDPSAVRLLATFDTAQKASFIKDCTKSITAELSYGNPTVAFVLKSQVVIKRKDTSCAIRSEISRGAHVVSLHDTLEAGTNAFDRPGVADIEFYEASGGADSYYIVDVGSGVDGNNASSEVTILGVVQGTLKRFPDLEADRINVENGHLVISTSEPDAYPGADEADRPAGSVVLVFGPTGVEYRPQPTSDAILALASAMLANELSPSTVSPQALEVLRAPAQREVGRNIAAEEQEIKRVRSHNKVDEAREDSGSNSKAEGGCFVARDTGCTATLSPADMIKTFEGLGESYHVRDLQTGGDGKVMVASVSWAEADGTAKELVVVRGEDRCRALAASVEASHEEMLQRYR